MFIDFHSRTIINSNALFIHVNRPQTYTFVSDGAKQKKKRFCKTFLQLFFAFFLFFTQMFFNNVQSLSPSAQTTASAKAKAQTPSLLTVPNLLTSKFRPPRAKYRQSSYDPNEISPAVLMPTRDTPFYPI